MGGNRMRDAVAGNYTKWNSGGGPIAQVDRRMAGYDPHEDKKVEEKPEGVSDESWALWLKFEHTDLDRC